MDNERNSPNSKTYQYTREQKLKTIEILLNNYDPKYAKPRFDKVYKILKTEYGSIFAEQTPSPTLLSVWWRNISPALKQRIVMEQAVKLQAQTHSLLQGIFDKASDSLPGVSVETAKDFGDLVRPAIKMMELMRDTPLTPVPTTDIKEDEELAGIDPGELSLEDEQEILKLQESGISDVGLVEDVAHE